MTENTLIMIAGALLSLVFSYVPGAKNWFDNLEKNHPLNAGNYKRLIMLAFLLVGALGAFGLACVGRYDAISCDVDGIWSLIEVFVWAVIGNQAAYMIAPKKYK